MSDTIPDAVLDAIDEQLKERGVASVKLADGQMMSFSEDMLEKLLLNAKASGTGRVALWLHSGASA